MCETKGVKTVSRKILSKNTVKSIIKIDDTEFNIVSNFNDKVQYKDLLYKIVAHKIQNENLIGN